MTAQTWVSVVLAGIAFASLLLAVASTRAALGQTRLQQKAREDAAQPYVWADLRPDRAQAGLLLLELGNAGPTVATNVRVQVDPPLEDRHARREGAEVLDRLQTGISSLAPGRRIEWSFGAVLDHIQQDKISPKYTLSVDADGPYGPVPTLVYDVSLEEIRHSLAVGTGSLKLLTESLNKNTDAIKDVQKALQLRHKMPLWWRPGPPPSVVGAETCTNSSFADTRYRRRWVSLGTGSSESCNSSCGGLRVPLASEHEQSRTAATAQAHAGRLRSVRRSGAGHLSTAECLGFCTHVAHSADNPGYDTTRTRVPLGRKTRY